MAELGVIGLRVLSLLELLGLLVNAAALLTWLERRFLCGEGGDG